MLYYSLNHKSPRVNFREATIHGQAPDKGLYFPEEIPVLPNDFIIDIRHYSKLDIAWQVIEPYVSDSIPQRELKRIIEETINFDFPLVKINENISSLELFHGPTLAFKDVGARFMSRCLGYFVKDQSEGDLKVSFFEPFYTSYIIFDLDQENYQYAFIFG